MVGETTTKELRARAIATIEVIEAINKLDATVAIEILDDVRDSIATPRQPDPFSPISDDEVVDHDVTSKAVPLNQESPPAIEPVSEQVATKLVVAGYDYDSALRFAKRAIRKIGKRSGIEKLVAQAKKFGAPNQHKSNNKFSKRIDHHAREVAIVHAVQSGENRADAIAKTIKLNVADTRNWISRLVQRGWLEYTTAGRGARIYSLTPEGEAQIGAKL